MNAKQVSPVLVFGFLLLVFFPNVFFGGKVFIANMSDMHLVNYSFASFFNQSMRQGVFPFWNPLTFCGYPFGADALSNVNLVNLLAFVRNSADEAWNLVTLANVFFAAVFTYAYLRQIKLSRFPAHAAGVIFAFSPSSGTSVDSWGFFLPLVLWLIERYEASREIRCLAFIFFSFGLLILNALPQYSLYVGIFFLIYAAVRWRSSAAFWVLIFSVGSVSFYTFRLLELLSVSGRSHLWFVNVFLPTHLINFIFPFFFESPFRPETNFFFSKAFHEMTRAIGHGDTIQYLLPPYISVLGFSWVLFSRKANPLSRFYLFAVWSILIYMMTFPLLAPVYAHVPILAQLPRIERLNPVWTFSLAVLAGMGAEKTLSKKVRIKKVASVYLALTVFVVSLLLGLRLLVHAYKNELQHFLSQYLRQHVIGKPGYSAPPDFYRARVEDFFRLIHQWTNVANPSIVLPVLFMVLSLSLIYFWQRRKISRTFYLAGCFLVLSADLLIFFRSTQYYGASPRELKPESNAIEFLKKDKELFRIMTVLDQVPFGRGRERHVLAPNSNLLYGLASVEGYDPVFPGQYARFFRNFQTHYEKDPAMILGGGEGDFDYSVLNLLNVKYLVTHGETKLRERLPLVFEDGESRVYFNPSYFKRAFLVYDYRLSTEPEEMLNFLRNKKINLSETVVLKEKPVLLLHNQKNARNIDRITFERYTPHAVDLTVTSRRDGILVLTDNDYPGWKATRDGVPVKIFTADFAFRGIEVPQGTHSIQFRYEPASFEKGFAASMVSLIGFILFLLFLNQSKRMLR